MTGRNYLRESMENAVVMKRGKYSYFIHPLTDSIPPIEPELLKQVCRKVMELTDTDVDYYVTMEAMGIHICAVLGQMTDTPFNIIRKRPYGVDGEVLLRQETGYSNTRMYLNNVKKGDVVSIVDAVISTGGTLVATIQALLEKGAIIKDIVCVIERGDGVDRVHEETGYKVKTLIKIEVGENVEIIDCID